jgi:hypothetical protein
MAKPGNVIPQWSRTIVKQRAHMRCERCRVPSPKGQWHHRRRRGVTGPHRHCPCNGVWLCNTCHVWVHQHPVEARDGGWIVSAYEEQPGDVGILAGVGHRFHDCTGGVRFE